MDETDAAEPGEEAAEEPAEPEAAEPEEAAPADEEMPPEEVAEEVKEEVKPEIDDVKLEAPVLKTDDNEWYPGTISKINHESGRVEYSVKWEEYDAEAGEEEETDGFSAEELKPRGEEAEDFPVSSLKRSADTDGEPPLKRMAVDESNG